MTSGFDFGNWTIDGGNNEETDYPQVEESSENKEFVLDFSKLDENQEFVLDHDEDDDDYADPVTEQYERFLESNPEEEDSETFHNEANSSEENKSVEEKSSDHSSKEVSDNSEIPGHTTWESMLDDLMDHEEVADESAYEKSSDTESPDNEDHESAKRTFTGSTMPELSQEQKDILQANKNEKARLKKKKQDLLAPNAERAKKIKKASRKQKKRKHAESELGKNKSTVIEVDNTGKPVRPGHSAPGRPKKSVGESKLNDKEKEFFANLRINYMRRDAFAQAAALLGKRPENEWEERKRLARIKQGIAGVQGMKKNNKFRPGVNDFKTLDFLAMFKYASIPTLALLCGVLESTQSMRMNRLLEAGFVKCEEIYGVGKLWYISKIGMLIAGHELPHTTKRKINISMIAHQFVVNHIAAALWSGGINVLDEEGAPFYNRDGNLGEKLVSELMITSNFSRVAGMSKAIYYREIMLGNIKKSFKIWESQGKKGPSPEFLNGNEYMWALIPPASLNLNYHFPDLVIPRERTPEGKPQSVAVEIELSNKSLESYVRTLSAYRMDKVFYSKVVWVVGNKGSAKKLEDAAKIAGLWDEGRIEIVPILTHDGVYTGNLWEL